MCWQAAPYREDEVVVIVPADHELAGAATIDREALAGLPFVSLHRSSTVAAIRAELESHGIDWQHLRVIMARAGTACFVETCAWASLPYRLLLGE